MTIKLELLEASLRNALGEQLQSLTQALGEITIVVKSHDYASAMRVSVSYTHLRAHET